MREGVVVGESSRAMKALAKGAMFSLFQSPSTMVGIDTRGRFGVGSGVGGGLVLFLVRLVGGSGW